MDHINKKKSGARFKIKKNFINEDDEATRNMDDYSSYANSISRMRENDKTSYSA